ncbi:MAG: metallophosphoesterase family protein [Acidobacteria bacterium]|nr:metallophosphoesterase family protein [Acidobacteriota bacterium]
MKIAVLADIHGNLPALEAVLAHAREAGADRFLDLGDVLYGPLWPQETFEVMRRLEAPTVRGNEDRELVEAADRGRFRSETVRFSVEAIGPEGIRWLRSLPSARSDAEGLFLCHGTPSNDKTYLLEDVSRGFARVRPEREISAALEGVTAPVVLCGHSHIPNLVAIPGGRIVVNPGSVGLPAYDDDAPVPHVMETFAPHASYALLERADDACRVALHSVPYDHPAAARRARENGRPDWAAWLETGRA